jgi:multidrug efflux system outer membrane protein
MSILSINAASRKQSFARSSHRSSCYDTENDALDCVAFHSTILNVLEARRRSPSSRALPERHLRRLATQPGEKSGLGRFLLSAILAHALLSGCKVGPDYTPPEAEMPDAWHQELTKGLAVGEANLQTWWTLLGDPVLDTLVQRAAQGNLDLQTAFARIVGARAALGVASGEKYPVIDAGGTAERFRFTEETTPFLPRGQNSKDNFFQTGLDASWEIDIFGRIRRSVESADATLEASVEAYRDVLVLLYADVAINYVEARALQERIRLAQANIEAQRATLQLVQDRFNAQLVGELDIRQAELNLANTESALPTLRILLTQTIHRLGVLLGERPSALHPTLSDRVPIPGTPPDIAVGLPADLLRQRPDIRQAERQLAAQTALIGVATADLYPRFSISGTLALESNQIGNLYDASSSYAFGIGPSFRWNLFSGGRVRGNIRVEDARTEQALVAYEQTLLLALEDVENAMVAYVQEIDRRDVLTRSVDAAAKSVELVQTRYREGLTDFQNVLDTQRSLFQQQDQRAASQGQVTQNVIRIYKALGGGWSIEEETTETADADGDTNEDTDESN